MTIYFRSYAMTKETMEARITAFSALQKDAILHLKTLGIAVTPASVLEFQEALAIEKRITPPHWKGWVYCDKCGISPDSEAQGTEVTACNFCAPPSEDANHSELLIPGMIAHANRIDFHIDNLNKGAANDAA